MKYTTLLNGKEYEVDIRELDRNRFSVEVDGRTHVIEACFCNSGLISLLIDHFSYDISYSFDKDTVHLNFRNQYFHIDVLDERKMRMRRVRSSLDTSGPEIIKTSMPGRVVKILVESGDEVQPGTGIIIIEAMKMENVIQCRRAGRVKQISVKPGQALESDVVLVEIEPAP